LLWRILLRLDDPGQGPAAQPWRDHAKMIGRRKCTRINTDEGKDVRMSELPPYKCFSAERLIRPMSNNMRLRQVTEHLMCLHSTAFLIKAKFLHRNFLAFKNTFIDIRKATTTTRVSIRYKYSMDEEGCRKLIAAARKTNYKA
jgi:hypothetical protein